MAKIFCITKNQFVTLLYFVLTSFIFFYKSFFCTYFLQSLNKTEWKLMSESFSPQRFLFLLYYHIFITKSEQNLMSLSHFLPDVQWVFVTFWAGFSSSTRARWTMKIRTARGWNLPWRLYTEPVSSFSIVLEQVKRFTFVSLWWFINLLIIGKLDMIY